MQGRLARSAFCSWQDYVQTDCAHKEEVAAQAAQRVVRQRRASAFSAWLGLHHQCQDDLKFITFCRRCSSRASVYPTHLENESGRRSCLSADAVELSPRSCFDATHVPRCTKPAHQTCASLAQDSHKHCSRCKKCMQLLSADVGTFPCRRAAKRRLQRIWQAWQQAAQHRAHVRHYLATSILRICHRSTGTAFSQWKEYVQASIALRDQQEQAVSHMLSVRLHHALIAWRRQSRQRQQLQVCPSSVLVHACRA